MNRDEVIDIRQFKPPRISLSMILAGLVVIGLLWVASTSWYTIEPEEVGVVLRFGKYVGEKGPGFHFKAPFGIDEVKKVPVKRQLTEAFGFRIHTPGRSSRGVSTTSSAADEALMLTGDLNVAEVEWIVQFRVSDPNHFLFKVRNVGDTFRDMSEATMREVVGDRTVNEVLTVGRQEIATEAARLLQELCEQYETGLTVEQVVLQDVNPPEQVKDSFNEVNQAQQEREKLINQARAEYNQAIPRARGEAQQTIEQAHGYALDRVNRATGEAQRFVAVYNAYRKAPEVTRRRIYLETLSQVLPKLKNKVILDEQAGGVLPLLQLGKEVKP
jgi:membrane protease subunit HflK